MPLFIVLELSFHRIKVQVEVVLLGLSIAKVKLHSCVVAFLQFGLLFFLVVVEVLIEVWNLAIIQVTGCHAVFEDNSSGRFEIEALVISITS